MPGGAGAVADRTCRNCAGQHLARDCPTKKQNPLKATEDKQQLGMVRTVFSVEGPDGYKPQRARGARRAHVPRGRPAPRDITMADFVQPVKLQNASKVLSDERGAPIKGPSSLSSSLRAEISKATTSPDSSPSGLLAKTSQKKRKAAVGTASER